MAHAAVRTFYAVLALAALVVPISGMARADRPAGCQLLWEQKLSAEPSAPLVQHERVFVATASGEVSAYRLDDGHLAWSARVAPTPSSPPPASVSGSPGDPATPTFTVISLIGGNRQVIAVASESFERGSATAYDEATGKLLWRFEGRNSTKKATPLMGGGLSDGRRVWIVTYLGLLCLDAATGKELWFHSSAPPGYKLLHPRANPLVMSNGELLHYTNFGVLYVVDPVTGALKWRYVTASFQAKAAQEYRQFRTTSNDCAPFADKERIYIGDGLGNIYALARKAGGKPQWQQSLGYCFRFVEDGARLIALTDRGMFSIDRKSGKVLQHMPGYGGYWYGAVVRPSSSVASPQAGVTSGFFYSSARPLLTVVPNQITHPGWSAMECPGSALAILDTSFSPYTGMAAAGNRLVLCGATNPPPPPQTPAPNASKPAPVAPVIRVYALTD